MDAKTGDCQLACNIMPCNQDNPGCFWNAQRKAIQKCLEPERCVPDYFKIGRLVQQGMTEILPHTGCKGEYHSPDCREVLKTNQHGCVLMYYCREASDANRAANP